MRPQRPSVVSSVAVHHATSVYHRPPSSANRALSNAAIWATLDTQFAQLVEPLGPAAEEKLIGAAEQLVIELGDPVSTAIDEIVAKVCGTLDSELQRLLAVSNADALQAAMQLGAELSAAESPLEISADEPTSARRKISVVVVLVFAAAAAGGAVGFPNHPELAAVLASLSVFLIALYGQLLRP